MKEKQKTKERGITLIALIVTIIVLIILSVVSINAIFGADGIINQARKTKLITDFTVYIEEKKTYDSEKAYENSNYSQESLNAGRTTLAYNTQGENTEGNIQTVIPSMTNEMAEKFEIIKGEFLLYASDELEREVAEQLGIKLSPYLIEDGVLLSANENLELQTTNGVVTLPERVTEIGAGAFSGVEGLKEVIIPGTVKVIQDDAFSYNTEIEKVTIMYGVLSIGKSAFKSCSNLKEIIVPDSVVEIGQEAFYGCYNLTSVQLSNNIETLEAFTFRYCNNLTTINIPNNLKSINADVFTGCTSLDNLTIPAGVTYIDSTSFVNCTNLYNLTIDANNNTYELEDGIIYKKDKSTLIMLASVAGKETITIQEGIKELGDGTLSICTNMKTINLPSTLQSISGNTFSQISSLETINIPESNEKYKAENGYLYSKDGKELIYVVPTKSTINIAESVETIKSGSIMNNKQLTELVIPDNVLNIEIYIFQNMANLKKIQIGSGVMNLSPAFKTWGGMQSELEITIDSNNLTYKVEGNLILSKDGTRVITYINNVEELVVPEGVEILEQYAFTDFQATKIILPSTLKGIDSLCFNMCVNLKEIEIPNSIEYIVGNAFASCSMLETVKIDKEKGSISGSPWSVPKGERAIVWLR